MKSPLPKTALKFAFVVDDLDKYLERFAALFGMETPVSIVTGPQEETQMEYRGAPTDGRARLGYIPLENITLELIEPIGGPSIWQSYLDARGSGLHHIAFIVNGMSQVIADLDSLGLPLAQQGVFPALGKAPSGNYDYQHKYFTDDTEYLCPAPLSAALTEQIQAISLKAYHAVGCEGWARVDFMLDQDDKPWLLEINTSPGMTDHSLVPMAAAADGISYDELVAQILATASLKVATPDLSASGLTPSGESN